MSRTALASETRNLSGFCRSIQSRNWLWGVLLLALVLVAYARVFNAGFIWDDESHLTQNPCIVGPLGLKEVWTSTQAVYYPLVLTTFWVLHKLVGLNPLTYHLLNVLLHAASAILLWRLLKLLQVRGAWLGAALWALHPVMVQSVAWVTELKNTQSCLFYLLSIFCFLKWDGARRITRLRQGCGGQARISRIQDATNQGNAASNAPRRQTGRRSLMLFALSLFFFVLATLSKPSVVMLPVVLVLCIWWQTGRISRPNVLALVPFVLISAVASVWTIFEQKFHAGAIGAEWAQTWPERLIVAGRAVWFYLANLVWPHPLIFIYPRWKINSSQLTAYLPLVAAIAGLLALWLIRAKWSRAVFFTLAYYVVSLFPVLGFFSVYFFRYSFVSDHFQYLASMGPLALAGAGIVTGCNRLPAPRRLSALSSTSRDGAVVTTPLVGICGVLLLSLVFLTLRQTALYHDLVTLYTRTLARNPGCWMAHYNLGIALNDQGNPDGAIAHYRKAID